MRMQAEKAHGLFIFDLIPEEIFDSDAVNHLK